jgi:hypothetical protein
MGVGGYLPFILVHGDNDVTCVGLCGGVILLVFGWVACVISLLRVKRSMEANRRLEEKQNQVWIQ